MGEVTAGWGLSGLVGVIQMCRTEHPIVLVVCMAVRKWTVDVEVVRNCGPSKGSQQHGLEKDLSGPVRRAEETLRQRTLLQPEVSK